MAKIHNLLSENATISSKLDANIIKGQSYEGLPIATDTNNGTVMIDNITIKNNSKGQLYCTVTGDNANYDESIIVNHIQNGNVHLSETQANSILNSNSHIADGNKHLSIDERNTINKVGTHILDTNIHIDQEKIANIELGINHISDSTLHLSINDKDNLNKVSPHIDNSNIHVTQDEKDKIGIVNTHVNNSNIHLSEEDRENINTTLSIANTFPEHLSNNNIHFTPYEKEQILQKISDNENLATDLGTLKNTVNNIALSKLDSGNHESNKMLVTDNVGNIVYSELPSNLVNINNTVKKRGYNFHIGDNNWQPNLSELKAIADMCKHIGTTSVELVFYIGVNNITTWDFVEYVNLENVKAISQYLYELGISSDILKIHCITLNKGENMEDVKVDLFNGIRDRILVNIIPTLKEYGLTTVVMSNECQNMTNRFTYYSSIDYYKAFSNYLLGEGLKRSITFAGTEELVKCSPALMEMIDVIGLNEYPSVSSREKDWNLQECIMNLEKKLKLKELCSKFNKPIYISETGCMDYIYSLSSPTKWDYEEQYKISSNGITQTMYMEAWFNYLKDNADMLEGFYIWDSTFSGFRPTENTKELLKRWWK